MDKEEIGSERRFLGIVAENDNVAAQVLFELGLTYELVKRMSLAVLGERPDLLPESVRVPLSARTLNVTRIAMRAAGEMGHTEVTPEHLLLSLLQEDGPAGNVLARKSLQADEAKPVLPASNLE